MVPDKYDSAFKITSLTLYVFSSFKWNRKLVLAKSPAISALGVIKTVVPFCVTTISKEEKETEVVSPLFHYFWKGVWKLTP